jgi:hypothetical protein
MRFYGFWTNSKPIDAAGELPGRHFNGCASFWKQTELESVFLTIATLKPKGGHRVGTPAHGRRPSNGDAHLDSSSLPVPRRHFSRRKEGRLWQCTPEPLPGVGARGRFAGTGELNPKICFGRYQSVPRFRAPRKPKLCSPDGVELVS